MTNHLINNIKKIIEFLYARIDFLEGFPTINSEVKEQILRTEDEIVYYEFKLERIES